MTVTPFELQENQSPIEQEAKEPLRFRQEVEIKGLKYIFEGEVPEDPTNFEWSVSVPNWAEQKLAGEAMMIKKQMNPDFGNYLRRHNLDNGRVGVIEIDNMEAPDKSPAIRVGIVRAETVHLPEEFGYNQARGVGSFLVDNLCTFADIKNWRLYLTPVNRGGNLSQGDLYRWYKSRGFQDEYQTPEETHYEGDMMRSPGVPDISRPIASILQSTLNPK